MTTRKPIPTIEQRIESLKEQIDYQREQGNHKVADLLCGDLSELQRQLKK